MIVGLTGGIGSGKSTVADFFRKLGVPVYDSDSEAKQLMTASDTVRNAVIDLFGRASYNGKKLNKNYISSIVFKDADKLERLNKIVHPAVRKHFLKWVQTQNAPYVIQETALIFENNAQDNYDSVILVMAPETARIQRVVHRDGVSEDEVSARIAHQLSDDIKSDMADFVIENVDLFKTEHQVMEIHKQLIGLVES